MLTVSLMVFICRCGHIQNFVLTDGDRIPVNYVSRPENVSRLHPDMYCVKTDEHFASISGKIPFQGKYLIWESPCLGKPFI